MVLLGVFFSATYLSLGADGQGEIVDGAQLERKPEVIKSVPPIYPKDARRGLLGHVLVELIVGVDGRVESGKAKKSSHPCFEQAAVAAVLQWTFAPGQKDGRPVRTRVWQYIKFDLPDNHWRGFRPIEMKAALDRDLPEFQWDQPPMLRAVAGSVYPFELLRAKTKGHARVALTIGKNGRLTQAVVVEATAPEFGLAMLAMVDSWQFRVASKNGEACAAKFLVRHEFLPSGIMNAVRHEFSPSGIKDASTQNILKEMDRASPEIYEGTALDQPPRPISQPAPYYPLSKYGSGQIGEALIEFVIDAKGDVQLPRIVTCSAPEFGYAAAQAVSSWSFLPPLKNKRPVIARIQMPVVISPPPPDDTAAQIAAIEPKHSDRIYEPEEIAMNGKPPQLILSRSTGFPGDNRAPRQRISSYFSFIVDHLGNVRDVCALGSTAPDLVQYDINKLNYRKYLPGEINGQPVNVRVEQLFSKNGNDSSQGGLGYGDFSKAKKHVPGLPDVAWDTLPTPLRIVYPVYPFSQFQAGVEERVKVTYLVGPDGRARVEKLATSGTPEFGLAVRAMVDAWRFEPAQMRNGDLTSIRLTEEFSFTPKGKKSVPVSSEMRTLLDLLNKNPEQIVESELLDEPLAFVSQRPPEYPSALKPVGPAGTAEVEFYINAKGVTQLPRIVSSSAPEFGYAAVQAVAAWRFKPPMRAGKPVIASVRLPVDFKPPEP